MSAAVVVPFIARAIRPRPSVGRRPNAETMFYALLVKAQREGRLDQEAAEIGITPIYAEQLLRRYPLFSWDLRKKVEKVIAEKLQDDHMVEVWRPLGATHRFHF
jgi:hypothetical protein